MGFLYQQLQQQQQLIAQLQQAAAINKPKTNNSLSQSS
jgi:hypothetical protein